MEKCAVFHPAEPLEDEQVELLDWLEGSARREGLVGADGRGLPRFVRRELMRYLACGVLAFGFARVHPSLTPAREPRTAPATARRAEPSTGLVCVMHFST